MKRTISRKIDHTGNNLLSKIIIARVIDHTGNNLLGKIIIARVVKYYVKLLPVWCQYKKLLPSGYY